MAGQSDTQLLTNTLLASFLSKSYISFSSTSPTPSLRKFLSIEEIYGEETYARQPQLYIKFRPALITRSNVLKTFLETFHIVQPFLRGKNYHFKIPEEEEEDYGDDNKQDSEDGSESSSSPTPSRPLRSEFNKFMMKTYGTDTLRIPNKPENRIGYQPPDSIDYNMVDYDQLEEHEKVSQRSQREEENDEMEDELIVSPDLYGSSAPVEMIGELHNVFEEPPTEFQTLCERKHGLKSLTKDGDIKIFESIEGRHCSPVLMSLSLIRHRFKERAYEPNYCAK
ncbi:hypothetical protein G9A89_012585 [Geosiphon pyriformis]|nr:hypothetical protein G9A89_012585 [Geosiphon pyriformis]